MGQQLLFKRKHRVVPIHGHVYRILGDPGAVSRVNKMFVVKVYCKIETSPIIEMSFYYPWCPGARLDLTVNVHHAHFIDPTNCPWVSEDACIENWSMRSLGQWILENKVYLLSMLGQKKKVHDCDYVFGSSTKFQRRMNGFVKADICHQVLKCLFTCILRNFICP